MRVIERNCAVCGDEIEIKVAEDGTYEGGAFFGDILPPDEEEYWECPDCLPEE